MKCGPVIVSNQSGGENNVLETGNCESEIPQPPAAKASGVQARQDGADLFRSLGADDAGNFRAVLQHD